MSSPDRFEATFRLRLNRGATWERLAGNEASGAGDHLWLAGFDANVTIVEIEPPNRLRATKDEEPCAGTDVVVTLDDDATGTRIHVVQSRFGDWLSAHYDMMAIGWRYIIADLNTYLVTGVHPRRHLRPWGDLGAETAVVDGGLQVQHVRAGGLAHQLGLTKGDLLVTLAGAPVASLDDLVTILRVLLTTPTPPAAEWIRANSLMTTP
jgi:uncharacterized protein YndB with AHSA1/START domain